RRAPARRRRRRPSAGVRARPVAAVRRRVGMDGERLSSVSRIPAAGGRARRVQRQVHGEPDGLARRFVRDAAITHSRELSQFLSARRTLAVPGHPPRAGFVMGYRADVHVDDGARRAALADDVRRGLGAREKWLPPKYFYDAAGSALFERITQLPEYYLTRAEHALLDAYAPAILDASRPQEIVELGAGSPAKVRRLLAVLNGAGPLERYVPVDVDGSTLDVAGHALLSEGGVNEVHAVVADFEQHLDRVPPP